jgi:two-component system, LytTR family, response regulator
MMTCIAIDDEPLALEVIKKYASDTPLIQLINTFTDAIQALSFIKVHPVDLIILDIQMPDISGIQFFQSLQVKPMVIFTTAYSEYAVKGFELEAIDYLVKPVHFDRFIKALLKARKVISRQATKVGTDESFFFVKSGYAMVRITFNDILYIEGLDDYIKIHFVNKLKPPVLSLMSLKSVMEKLPEDQFKRVHRSFIIPLQKITSIRNKTIYLEKNKVPLGDTYADSIREWLANY